ncbi:ABC transporter ATP-binding protein [Tardiphaga sp.]|jgi:branched-chain amino acid transport system ATP-binding protein|uniref:ABC transporter ATP-binding protein n=1 Tax=Tardiphaga sp. TaxID=1926292 RepID=UPI0037D99A3A
MTALSITDLSAGYGVVPILHEVSIEVAQGEVVAVLGANGAGKSTMLRCLSGLLPFTGEAAFYGTKLSGLQPHLIARLGLVQVPEARHIFSGLTVVENLRVGATPLSSRAELAKNLDQVLSLFPILAQRRNQIAGTMSGGQQQMLAIGRALMGGPKLLVLDEPSLGLAPLVVAELYEAVRHLIADGLTVLLVEQDVSIALQMAHRGYVIENGKIALQGTGDELRKNEHIRSYYLGT